MQPTKNSTEELKEINKRINDIVNGHELNSILVANPDMDCDYEETVISPTNEAYSYNHLDYFEVKWGGQPHRLKPGETRVMPAFLAKHFAKHLADHILIKREEATNRPGLLQSPIERPRVLATILLRVQDYFMQDNSTPGEQVEQMVDRLNPVQTGFNQTGEGVHLPETNLGKAVDPVIGVLKPEPLSKEQIMANAGLSETKTSIYDESKPKPSKKELISEAVKLGLDINGKETVDQLIGMIKQF